MNVVNRALDISIPDALTVHEVVRWCFALLMAELNHSRGCILDPGSFRLVTRVKLHFLIGIAQGVQLMKTASLSWFWKVLGISVVKTGFVPLPFLDITIQGLFEFLGSSFYFSGRFIRVSANGLRNRMPIRTQVRLQAWKLVCIWIHILFE